MVEETSVRIVIEEPSISVQKQIILKLSSIDKLTPCNLDNISSELQTIIKETFEEFTEYDVEYTNSLASVSVPTSRYIQLNSARSDSTSSDSDIQYYPKNDNGVIFRETTV